MPILIKEIKVGSTDGIHTLSGKVYLPEGKAKGFFHAVHGMTEHIGRYDHLLRTMAENGWVSFAYDHLGHGNTADNDGELGYIAKNNGWDILAKDVKAFSEKVTADYYSKNGDDRLPYVLMGHSMGSFVARVAAEKYVRPSKLILMGTAGENKASGAGLALVKIIKSIKGEKHISRLLNGIAFGSYNDRFGGGTSDDPKPWLSTVDANRKLYYADKFCMFDFTVSAMGDLIRLIKECNRPLWFENIDKNMPILIISGEDDPVGDFGKGVKQVYSRLNNAGAKPICKLYPGARHELLQETVREECISDIISFSAE